MECLVDSREMELFQDLQSVLTIPTIMKMLPLGDVVVQTTDGNLLLMIERKSVRDLVQSLRDGRYHDQRKRWVEYKVDSPSTSISLWLEGDLLSTDMDPMLRSSLLNALFRLQSLHRVIVHTVRTRAQFIQSLQMVIEKLVKDPYHLVEQKPTTVIPLHQYRKSAHSQETYWQSCLAMIPGISMQIAQKLIVQYPSMLTLMEKLQENREKTVEELSEIRIHEKRRLGKKQAQKIVAHMLNEINEEEKIKISV